MIGMATGALVTAVWQGILLAAAVWVGLRMLPKTPAAVRFAIWFGVFLVVTALPLASLWSHSAGTMHPGGAWFTFDVRWSVVIAAVWAAASLVRAGKLVVAAVRVRGLWKRATSLRHSEGPGLKPLNSSGHLPQAEECAEKLGHLIGRPWIGRDFSPDASGIKANNINADFSPCINADLTPCDTPSTFPAPSEACCYSGNAGRRAELCVSDEVDRPTVIGFFAPKILIPGWLLEKLTPAELDQIVLHEMSHLGRADDWMNLLQKIALVIFPLNPALAWVERRLCFERELAVDERVLRASAGRTGAATEYATCLATVAEHRLGRRGLALALGALGRESELGRRVMRILERRETMRPAHARLVLGGALVGLLTAGVGLERCPQVVGFAQSQGTAIREQGTVAMADVVNLDRPQISSKDSLFSGLQSGANVPREVVLEAGVGAEKVAARDEKIGPQRLKPWSRASVYGTAEAVPLSKTDRAEIRGAAKSMPSSKAVRAEMDGDMPVTRVGMSRPEGQPRVTQWVVVTAWQGADGSRLVMTNETIENPAARANRSVWDVAPAPEQQQDLEQVHPYAAVPVRGGWLIVQL